MFQGIKKFLEKLKSKDLDSSLCVMPWKNLELRSHGVYAPCCMNHPDSQSQQNLPYIHETSPSEAFHGAYMQALRAEMLKGVRPESCKNCWMNEDVGNESMRTRKNKENPKCLQSIREHKFSLVQPTSVDIKFGNKCNLKCRICSPSSSSFWLEEYEDIYGKNTIPRLRTKQNPKVQQLDKTVGWTASAEAVWTDLGHWLPNIQDVELYGGEPFLNKDMYALLEKSVVEGVAKKQKLHFNTNGTIYSSRLFEELFPEFQEVSMSLSLDGIGEQFEYQRFPAKWSTVLSNYEKMVKANVQLTICISVSALNFYYLPEYLEFWKKKNARIHLNEVTKPYYFDVNVYPALLKKEIEKKFQQSALADDEAVKTFLRQMNAKDQSHLWPEFLKTVKLHDAYRKQDYASVFPEFAALMGWERAPSNLRRDKEIQL